jgi:predicted Zn-dependent protease with MMP-like domain
MIDWTNVQAPSLAEFERLAEAAYARLPASFRELCEGVVIRVEDFPDDETVREMGLSSEFDLLGLFRGVGLAQGGATLGTGQFPNMVWLYRRPLLDYWAEHEETLGHLVSHVLIHEIGHHFGLSDEDMEAIEAAAERENLAAAQ